MAIKQLFDLIQCVNKEIKTWSNCSSLHQLCATIAAICIQLDIISLILLVKRAIAFFCTVENAGERMAKGARGSRNMNGRVTLYWVTESSFARDTFW
jgi:hypothetical protein